MNSSDLHCVNCGKPLKATAGFCGNCGSPVPAGAGAYPAQSPIPGAFQSPAPAGRSRGKTSLIRVLLFGISGLMTVCGLMTTCYGSGLFSGIGGTGAVAAVQGAQRAEMEEPGLATATPTQGEPSNISITPAGADAESPQLEGSITPAEEEGVFQDDFSSKANGWDEDHNNNFEVGYQGDAYFIHAREAQTITWVFPPIEFIPTSLEFDAWLPDDFRTAENGVYGIVCGFVDEGDYDSVMIDPANKTYSITRTSASQDSDLGSDPWGQLLTMNQLIYDRNRIRVECREGAISLSVNGEPVDTVQDDYFAKDGDMGIIVEAFFDVGPDGYKVMFDDFEASVEP